jgi:hypothetical protein
MLLYEDNPLKPYHKEEIKESLNVFVDDSLYTGVTGYLLAGPS